MEETMNKKIILCLILCIALCAFAGCDNDNDPSGSSAQPGSTATDVSPLPEQTAQPAGSPSPDPQPEITPPADSPADPASDTDIIYESETRPPDPASDTDIH